MLDTTLLGTYLTDHLGAASAALDLLGRRAREPSDAGLRAQMAGLRAAVAADRDLLVSLMRGLGIEPSLVKRVAGHVGESLAVLRFHHRLTGDPALSEIMVLESLIVGVSGKRLLWLGLADLAPADARLAGYDFAGLVRRAEAQAEELEGMRRRLVARTFTAGV